MARQHSFAESAICHGRDMLCSLAPLRMMTMLPPHLAQLLVLCSDVFGSRLLDAPDRRLCFGHLCIRCCLRFLQMHLYKFSTASDRMVSNCVREQQPIQPLWSLTTGSACTGAVYCTACQTICLAIWLAVTPCKRHLDEGPGDVQAGDTVLYIVYPHSSALLGP